MGVAGVAAYQVCFFSAVTITGVAVGTLVAIGFLPVVGGALGLALGERLSWRWWTGTTIGVCGGALLVVPGRGAVAVPLGVAFALGAGTAQAVYTAAAKRLPAAGCNGVAVVATFFAGAGGVLSPFLLSCHIGRLAAVPGVAMVAWLGCAATALPYLLFVRGLPRLPVSTATALGLAEPLSASLLGVFVLGETMTPRSAGGAALVAVGLITMSTTPPTRSPPTTTPTPASPAASRHRHTPRPGIPPRWPRS